MADTEIVRFTADAGDLAGAIEQGHTLVDMLVEHGEMAVRGAAVAALVEVLLRRGTRSDIQEAEDQIERLATLPTDPGFVLNEIQLLRMRALLAEAKDDDAAYRDFADRYGLMAKSLGFEGHMAIAEAMR
jgi:adenylate cyclase